MLAIGEFSVVEDNWKDMLVDYYVEAEYENYARRIFPHTVEMLGFFSDILGYEYPWAKYSQVVVRDYVSGAMENTTGVIFGEFMYGTDRDLVDVLTNDLIVAHEMMHHWFGDLVTCESWANLTLNEGFANYSEYLWLEHKYGANLAEYHRLGEVQGYLGSARRSGIRPIIDFSYADKEDMFDAHSYNKGGLVLHMLRQLTGDEAFYASLTRYLKDNAYTEVEGHELRLAFEKVTGQDWNWFFNQWFYSAGHPVLNITYDYNAAQGLASVSVEQLQDPEASPAIFILPTQIDILLPNGEKQRHEVVVNQRQQTFLFEIPAEPVYMQFDANRNLLAERDEEKTPAAYAAQYRSSVNFLDRYDALQALAVTQPDFANDVFEQALNDPSHALRQMAATQVQSSPKTLGKLRELALKDPHSAVRIAAMDRLAELEDAQLKPILVQAIENDFAYRVVGSALEILVLEDTPLALQYAKKLEAEPSDNLANTIGSVYVEAGDPANLPYFERRFDKAQFFGAIDFFSDYAALASQGDAVTVLDAAGKLQMIGGNASESLWRRFGATAGLNNLHSGVYARMQASENDAERKALKELDEKILEILNIVIGAESDKQLKGLYRRYPDPKPQP
jgi:aminopeptidase N